MARVLLLFIACCFLMGSCTQRSICPAFQSAFIYDKEALRKKFSYFLDDSTPKVFTASKNKYLVAEPVPYARKVRSLKTIAMKSVPVEVPDSLLNEDSVSVADLDRAARSVRDSIVLADASPNEPAAEGTGIYMISKDKELRLLKYNGADSLVYDPEKEKYVGQKPEYYVKDVRLNIDQDNYMWYLRDYLVLPDVRLAKLHQADEQKRSEMKEKQEAREKKGLKGFFRNLFKKKPKEEVDSTAVPTPPEQFDFIDVDTLSQTTPAPMDTATQKGFFAPEKKDTNQQGGAIRPSNPAQQPSNPIQSGDAQKKEDDGF